MRAFRGMGTRCWVSLRELRPSLQRTAAWPGPGLTAFACVGVVDRGASNARFASCGGDRSVFLWDVATQQTIKKFQGHSGKVNAVAFNEDESVLASGSFDTTVRLWDLKSVAPSPLPPVSALRRRAHRARVLAWLIAELILVLTGHSRDYRCRCSSTRGIASRAWSCAEGWSSRGAWMATCGRTTCARASCGPTTLIVSHLSSSLKELNATFGCWRRTHRRP